MELERVEISNSEEDFEYHAVDELSGDDSEDDNDEEDFQRVLQSLQKEKTRSKNSSKHSSFAQNDHENDDNDAPETEVRPSLVDDFIRNFYIKAGMTRNGTK